MQIVTDYKKYLASPYNYIDMLQYFLTIWIVIVSLTNDHKVGRND